MASQLVSVLCVICIQTANIKLGLVMTRCLLYEVLSVVKAPSSQYSKPDCFEVLDT
jgi:hypothetical protein